MSRYKQATVSSRERQIQKEGEVVRSPVEEGARKGPRAGLSSTPSFGGGE
jgi:hypothetical protein